MLPPRHCRPLMKRYLHSASFLLFAPAVLSAQTRMLRSPSIAGGQIAFAYANNIWIVGREGGTARRLTSFQGETSNPKLSPDGSMVAFSAQYGGNVDVYVVPSIGGEPKRLTWHPAADEGQGWTPDGKNVLFASARGGGGPPTGARLLPGSAPRGRPGAPPQ